MRGRVRVRMRMKVRVRVGVYNGTDRGDVTAVPHELDGSGYNHDGRDVANLPGQRTY